MTVTKRNRRPEHSNKLCARKSSLTCGYAREFFRCQPHVTLPRPKIPPRWILVSFLGNHVRISYGGSPS